MASFYSQETVVNCPTKKDSEPNIINVLPRCPKGSDSLSSSLFVTFRLLTTMVSGNIFDWIELPTLKYHWHVFSLYSHIDDGMLATGC